MTILISMVSREEPEKNGSSTTSNQFPHIKYFLRIDKNVKDVHIIDADEELVQEKRIIVLTMNQYCIIRNPIGKDKKPQYGVQELRKGEC